jgi:hypothetical protein
MVPISGVWLLLRGGERMNDPKTSLVVEKASGHSFSLLRLSGELSQLSPVVAPAVFVNLTDESAVFESEEFGRWEDAEQREERQLHAPQLRSALWWLLLLILWSLCRERPLMMSLLPKRKICFWRCQGWCCIARRLTRLQGSKYGPRSAY